MKKSAAFVVPPMRARVNKRYRKFHRTFPPLSEIITATLFRDRGWQVKVYDFHADLNLNWDEAVQQIRLADVCILTTNPYADWQCPSLDMSNALDLTKKIDHKNLILTGNHGTHYPGALIKMFHAKAVVRTEPEFASLAVAEALTNGGALNEIPNVSFIESDKIFHNPKGALANIDELPKAAYDLVDLANYEYELLGDRFALLEAARGCPFACNFCNRSMFQNKYRKKSIETFLAEVDDLIQTHDCRSLYVFDLEFTINKPLVKAFCNHLLQRNYKVKWACQTRADSVDPELLSLMKKSGCELIHFGVESGDPEILQSTQKRIKLEDIREGVKAAHDVGMKTAGFFIMGHPGETQEHLEKTLAFAKELDLTYASFKPLSPFPGSPLFEQRFGPGPYWDQAVPTEFTYFEPEQEKMVLNFVSKAFWKFYLRPKVIWRQLAHGDPSLYRRQIRLFLNFLIPNVFQPQISVDPRN